MTWQSMLNVVRNSKKILKFIVFFCYSLQLYALFENFMRRLCHNLQVIIISVKCQMQSAKRNPDKTRVISAEEERRSPGSPQNLAPADRRPLLVWLPEAPRLIAAGRRPLMRSCRLPALLGAPASSLLHNQSRNNNVVPMFLPKQGIVRNII